jgi:hypothetical protein
MNRDLEKEDLPVPAVFYSKQMYSGRVRLESVGEELVEGKKVRQPNTGFDVMFRGHRAWVKNSKVLKMMMQHNYFRHTGGWDIDEKDPTGFWEAMGLVKKVQRVETVFAIEASVRPELPNLAGIKSKFNAHEKKVNSNGGDSADSPGTNGAPGVDKDSVT